MKIGWLGLVVLALVCAFAGCKKRPELHLYCWADYISPEVIEEFEAENGCRVVYDTFDSNEVLLAKLQAGASGYDLIFPSHYVVDALANANAIVGIDHLKIGIMDNLDKDVLAMMPDKGCKYSIPYMMSYTGIGYNKDVLKDTEMSWTLFDRADFQKRATLLDDKREVIGAALLTLGLDPNSTNEADLERASGVIIGWKKNISKFENEQYKNGLASKEFVLVMGYSGDLVQIMEENAHVGFGIPKEGATMSCDMMAVPSTAKNPDLAYKFINFVHKPEMAAKNMEYVCYQCPNSAAYPLVSDELRSNPAVFVDKEAFARCHFIMDQAEKESVFNRFWDMVKNEKSH